MSSNVANNNFANELLEIFLNIQLISLWDSELKVFIELKVSIELKVLIYLYEFFRYTICDQIIQLKVFRFKFN